MIQRFSQIPRPFFGYCGVLGGKLTGFLVVWGNTCAANDNIQYGYYATTDKGAKYLRPEFVDECARNIAASLNEMKPAEFAAMLRDLKRAKKSTLPFEARKTAAAELFPRAIGLVHKKKAPSILTEFIKVNLAAIKTDDDWSAFYRHMNAINGFLMAGGDA